MHWPPSCFDNQETRGHYGYEEIYEGRLYTVLNINEMKDWKISAPVAETILINRKYLTPVADPPVKATPGAV